MPTAERREPAASRVVPAVSVVVPTYNRAAMLTRLLDALAAQVRPAGGFEVIVVDDGSIDSTSEVIAAAPLDVRAIRQANAGPAAARNRGWRAARGTIVAFTDDDCVPSSDWLVDLVAVLEQSGAGAVGGAITPLRASRRARYVHAEHLVDHGVDRRGVRYLVTANLAVRRVLLERSGGFDESFRDAAGEDTDFAFRLRADGVTLAVTDRAVVRHDDRTSWRGLLRTYRKHGRARAALAVRHTEATGGAGVRELTRPAHWRERYGRYREVAGPVEAAGFVLLRAIGLACFAWGYGVDSHRGRRGPAVGHAR